MQEHSYNVFLLLLAFFLVHHHSWPSLPVGVPKHVFSREEYLVHLSPCQGLDPENSLDQILLLTRDGLLDPLIWGVAELLVPLEISVFVHW